MAKRVIRRTPRVIDPMFFIPEGVDELVYRDLDAELEGQLEDEAEEEVSEEIILDAGEDDTDYSDTPETPTVVGVVPPQTIRTTATGNQVVDVVIEVEDIEGLEYEIRLSAI